MFWSPSYCHLVNFNTAENYVYKLPHAPHMQQKACAKAALCCFTECSASTALKLYHMEKYKLTHTLVRVSPGKGHRQQEDLQKSWSLLVGRALFSKVPAARPALPRPDFRIRDKHLGRTMWKCNPLPLTRQKPGDASVSEIKLSSSCLLVLYCTSFACCYSKNRTDSSSGGTTTRLHKQILF